ncbi:hypothetical protein HDU83_001826 [Entophlyctis luteolus]|nr:hypothetical protein HDU83_001826 [Entophlyctis luteolus]
MSAAVPHNSISPEPPYASETSPAASQPPESPALHVTQSYSQQQPLQAAEEEMAVTDRPGFGCAPNPGRVTRARRKIAAVSVGSAQATKPATVREQEDCECLPPAPDATSSKIDCDEGCENNDIDEHQTHGNSLPKGSEYKGQVSGQGTDNTASNRCGSRSNKKRKLSASNSSNAANTGSAPYTADGAGSVSPGPLVGTGGRPSARFKATEAELAILRGEFERDAFPNTFERQRIADGLGMEPRQVSKSSREGKVARDLIGQE